MKHLALLLSILALCAPRPISAQDVSPLKKIQRSHALGKIQVSRRKRPTVTKLSDNFITISQSPRGPQIAIEILQPPGVEYRIDKPKRRATQYNFGTLARMTERGGARRAFDVFVAIPHPNYYPLLEQRLIKPISELSPPDLEIKESQEVEINGLGATLYLHEDESCSVLFSEEPPLFVQVRSTTRCRNYEGVYSLAEKLQVEKLSEYLFPSPAAELASSNSSQGTSSSSQISEIEPTSSDAQKP